MENKIETTIQTQEKIDDNWYPIFKEIGSFEAFDYLDGDKNFRIEQKNKFLEGEIENPNLDYPKLDLDDLKNREAKLRELRREIKSTETDPLISQIYRWKINEKIAELEMLQATASGKMRNFKRYSEFVYGKPSPKIFAYTVQSIRAEIKRQLESEDPQIQNTAKQLAELLPEIPDQVQISPSPEEKSVLFAQKQTLNELGNLVDIPEIKDEYNAEEIKNIFESALKKLEAQGWQVVIDKSSKTGVSVSQEEMKVKVPESRKLLFKKLQTLVAHEIGTHVARRINGERSKLMLLGLGLNRYEKGEEGVATMREQAIGGEVKDFAGMPGHLAIGLGIGVDGKARNFREVYNILEKYFTFQSLIKGKNLEEVKEKAQNDAWNRCVRTFRGTDCQTQGVCFTKDIVYREGNIGIWDVIGKNPDEMMRFRVGKYDPANPRHIWILNQLGITEEDLKDLKKAEETA